MGEVALPAVPELASTSKVSGIAQFDPEKRKPVLVPLGCQLRAAAMPHPDTHHPPTALSGFKKRMTHQPPTPDPALLEKLRVFVRKYVRGNYRPLDSTSDVSLDTWLENTNYPLWRKEQLRTCWKSVESISGLKQCHFDVKCHIKDECYPEPKHTRGIYSRTDEFKCAVGPFFKLIESVVYADHHFIKHIPVRDRPKYIRDLLFRDGAEYWATDYTSFEALFVKALMEVCEMELYDWMTSMLPAGPEFMNLIRKVLLGDNRCVFSHFTGIVRARRMSGEMCTSLGNGFSNLMFMLFMAEQVGAREVEGVVEGDDGLFVMSGCPPTSDDFSRLGLIIKMEKHIRIETASFCGLVFHPDDLLNLTDPYEVLASFGYTSWRYARATRKMRLKLLRCKALSLAHQYPGCPVIQSLAFYGLRVTSVVDVVAWIRKIGPLGMSGWERDQLLAAIQFGELRPVAVPMATRLLFEELYGMSVEQQVSLENYLESRDDIVPLTHPSIDLHIPQAWLKYYAEFSRPAIVPDLDRPQGFLGVT